MKSILSPSAVEYFIDNGKVFFIKDKYIHPFSELPLTDAMALRRELESNTVALKAIENVITDPVKQIEQYAACRYGRLNETPDFVAGKSTDSEIPRPECAVTCKFECKICSYPKPTAKCGTPTNREIEIARLIPGRTDKEIAQALNISVNTVITHVARLLSKLGEHSRSGIVTWSINNHLI
jgi:DNA-binding CsgD family transcriptional regulator